ncbi:helix-turn-helix domain-containing protein [Alkalitalea saponilacus]|uniref:AraC-type DNA-binding protein n=1 Tax=Alkalitalea saponilacus TaxID=889453 RepID=A0A1T5B8I7_9BACT|nr:AraC family transcriptional regulator [Alkalitalea saponilacus]ASB49755.1 AraC family transcriptional regulator [Alkalitalea saponilacus]SKB43568.1 AraC-type DNA-binding protein [Alkalitalea saponilacus]
MKLYIKNMVCNRCILVIENLFKEAGFHVIKTELGEVEIKEELNPEQINLIESNLKPIGFKLIEEKKAQIIEKIKTSIIKLIHHSEEGIKINLSSYLSNQVNYDYNYISNLFSETEGKSIEKYYITQKIEKAKELLVYDELSLSQIADKLNYSSVAHLSSQFKKITGLTPTHFRKIKEKKRNSLDNL